MLKKMMKRMAAMCMALSLLALSGCQGKGVDQANNATEGAVKIGALAPLTGEVSIYGVTAMNGAKLAVAEINQKGGINGKKLELLLEDEQGDQTQAVNAYNKLVGEKIAALLGDITSGPTEAVAGLAEQDKIPMLTPTGTQDAITQGRDYVFRVCYTDSYQGKVLAKYTKEVLKAKTAAVLKNNSSDYSNGVADAFAKAAQELGIEVVAQESYGKSDQDFKAQLTNIANKNPDVLLVPDYYQVISLITPQARDAQVKSTFIGPDGWDGVLAQMNPAAYGTVEGALFTNHYSVDNQDQKVQDFIKAYRAEYKEDPSSFAALAYDGVYLLKEAMEKAGSFEGEKVKDAMKSISFDGVTGKLTFDKNNNPVKEVCIIKIENGKYKLDTTMSAQ